MLKFKKIIWFTKFIDFEVENWDPNDSIWDILWISEDWKTMSVSEYIEKNEVEELLNLFPRSQRQAVKGALRRMDLI